MFVFSRDSRLRKPFIGPKSGRKTHSHTFTYIALICENITNQASEMSQFTGNRISQQHLVMALLSLARFCVYLIFITTIEMPSFCLSNFCRNRCHDERTWINLSKSRDRTEHEKKQHRESEFLYDKRIHMEQGKQYMFHRVWKVVQHKI